MTQSALTPPDIGVTVGAWNALVRRARLGRERKGVALTFSSYADADGTGIHCGVARLAVDCEIGYSTARRYLAWMRVVGLIELVRHGNFRRGLSDEYRLVLGTQLLEHIDLPDPAAYDRMRDEIRNRNRAGSSDRTIRAKHLRSPEQSAEPEPQPEPSAPTQVSADTGHLRSPGTPSALTQDEPPPSLTTYPKELTSPDTGGNLGTDAAGPRVREKPRNSIPPMPELRSPFGRGDRAAEAIAEARERRAAAIAAHQARQHAAEVAP
ncbi:hypothetical protein GCM10010112_94010 [Actinoplanes lobatus]|uniref:Helix-turn-helix domain-containing protein n=1 Tax=Actinoplanes lobatus TaxID=113568 RepID=A0A7W7MG96_9ACTN|nr:hypothetical protein [Actinoplanes lobatus]MBB4749164.1 hypothetical protein [Actinoplanes lobatus]GGN99861.1 hypothetical protein GCM10010112_94010 [Actinoplanes lobatus]GIE46441.1 hypothetical protein Alo02nite_93390 [Actinoplanes lobatus]